MLSIKWNTQLSTKYPSIHHMLLCPNLDNPMGCVLNKICRKTMRKRPTMMLALNKYKKKMSFYQHIISNSSALSHL